MISTIESPKEAIVFFYPGLSAEISRQTGWSSLGTEERLQIWRYAGLLLARRSTERTSERAGHGRAAQMEPFLCASNPQCDGEDFLKTRYTLLDFPEA
jgi:hypothetical protein